MSIHTLYIYASEDTYITSASSTTNHDGEGILKCGHDGNIYNALLRFPLDDGYLPSNASIVTATVQLEVATSDQSGFMLMEVRPCLRDWVENEATYEVYSTGNSWTANGGAGSGTDSDSDYLEQIVINVIDGVGVGDIVNIDATASVRSLPDDGELNLLILTSGSGSLLSFHDRLATTQTITKPRLKLVYTTEESTAVNITKDTCIASSSDASPDEDDWNMGASTNLYVGWNSMRSQFYRALLSGDISSVSDVASVDKAILKLNFSSARTNPQAITISRLLQTNWVEGTGDFTVTDDGADWASYDGSNAWDSAGASTSGVDFTSANQISPTFPVRVQSGTPVLVDVTNLVNDALSDGKSSLDLIIKRTTEASVNEIQDFYSSDSDVSDIYKPQLLLFYTDHDFENDSGYCIFGRASSTQVSAFKVAKPNANVQWRIRYWPEGSPASDTTSSIATSAGLTKRERLEIEITGLSPVTRYEARVSENLNGAGWVESSQAVFFSTLGSSNTDNTFTIICSDSHDGYKTIGDNTVAGDNYIKRLTAFESFVIAQEPQLLIHGGDLSQPGHAYIYSNPDGIDEDGTHTNLLSEAQENVHRVGKGTLSYWKDILSTVACQVVPGNHEEMGWGWAHDYSPDDQYNEQVWFTEYWKTWFGNFATDLGEATSEWADPDDVTNEEVWVGADDSANRPPFESYAAIRHGPIEFFCVDVYRYSEVLSASGFILGATQEARLKADILASDALYKAVVIHHPTGGRDDGDNSAELYGRGGIGIAEQEDYDWFDLFAWLEDNGVDVVFGGHDHVAAVGRMLRKNNRPVFVSMSSPIAPFGGSTGYNRGYNANSNDPITGPFDDQTPDPDFEALYFDPSPAACCWVVDASSTRLRLQSYRTYDTSGDEAKSDLRFTLDLSPSSSGSSPGSGTAPSFSIAQTQANSTSGAVKVDQTVFDLADIDQDGAHYQLVERHQTFNNPLINIRSNNGVQTNGNLIEISRTRLSIILDHGKYYKFRYRTITSGTWTSWSTPYEFRVRNKDYKYEIDGEPEITESARGATVVNNVLPSDVASITNTSRGATVRTVNNRKVAVQPDPRGARVDNR